MNSGKRSLLNLQSLSKEELISLLLEKCPELASTSTAAALNVQSKKEKTEKIGRAFDPAAYESRKVALKVAYFGFKYQGFASQTGLLNMFNDLKVTNSNADTVEDHIFRALIRTRLILDPKTCNYSRCGRTDAGVSSTGQVIALRLRTSNRKSSIESVKSNELIDYVNVLNKQLPDDIRILDWAFVPDEFSARFSCSSRLYHYYFSKIHYDNISRTAVTLNIEKMQEATKLLHGIHDFRNFCKRDPSKPDQTFIREILDCFIEEVDSGYFRFVCKGSAFLYHQIRCIMSILFMIGMELEPVNLVTTMLERINPKNNYDPAGPLVHYEIASGIPLTLHECNYEKPGSLPIEWTNKGNSSTLSTHLLRLWESKQGEAMIIKGLLGNNPIIPENSKNSNFGNLLNLFLKASK